MILNLEKLEKFMQQKSYTREDICKICDVDLLSYPICLDNMSVDKFVDLCDKLEIKPSDILN